MQLFIELEIEDDPGKRWIAEINAMPGMKAYGQTKEQAIEEVKVIVLKRLVFLSRLCGENIPNSVSFTWIPHGQ